MLADDLDYEALPGLSNEVRHKLQTHRPRTIGQAGRIDGITPAALTLLVAHVHRRSAASAIAAPHERDAARTRAGLGRSRSTCPPTATGAGR